MTSPSFPYDDPYIVLHSARALRVGLDAQYPSAAPLDGATSPVHLALVWMLSVLWPASTWPLLLVSLLGMAACAWGLVRLGEIEGLTPLETALLVAAGLGTGPMLVHHLNGLETSLALAAIVWSIVWLRTNRLVPLAGLAGLMPFVRPELGLWSVLLLAWAGWRHPNRAINLLLVSGGAALPWLAWLYLSTGHVLPTTFHAKRHWFAESCWPLELRMRVVGEGMLLWLGFVFGALIGAWGLARSGVGRLALLAMAGMLATWTFTIPSLLHQYQRHRYLAPFAIWLVLGLAFLPAHWRRRALVIAGLFALITTMAFARAELEYIERTDAVRLELLDAVRQTGARRVMLHDAGYLAWAQSADVLVDMVGLKSPEAASLHASLTGPTCGAGRDGAVARLAEQTRPDALVIWEPWDRTFGVTHTLREAGWQLVPRANVGEGAPISVYTLVPPR